MSDDLSTPPVYMKLPSAMNEDTSAGLSRERISRSITVPVPSTTQHCSPSAGRRSEPGLPGAKRAEVRGAYPTGATSMRIRASYDAVGQNRRALRALRGSSTSGCIWPMAQGAACLLPSGEWDYPFGKEQARSSKAESFLRSERIEPRR